MLFQEFLRISLTRLCSSLLCLNSLSRLKKHKTYLFKSHPLQTNHQQVFEVDSNFKYINNELGLYDYQKSIHSDISVHTLCERPLHIKMISYTVYAVTFKGHKFHRFCCTFVNHEMFILEKSSALKKQCIQLDDQQKINHENPFILKKNY